MHRGGVMGYANPAVVRLSGAASAADLVGRPMLERVPPQWHPQLLERTRALLERRPVPAVTGMEFLRFNGSVIDATVQARLIDFDGQPAVQLASRDITEAQRAQHRLAGPQPGPEGDCRRY